MDEDGVKRHLDSQTHPDATDLQNAISFLECVLKKCDTNKTHMSVSICFDGEPCIECGLCSATRDDEKRMLVDTNN